MGNDGRPPMFTPWGEDDPMRVQKEMLENERRMAIRRAEERRRQQNSGGGGGGGGGGCLIGLCTVLALVIGALWLFIGS